MRHRILSDYLKLAVTTLLFQISVAAADVTGAETEAHLWKGVLEGRYYAIIRHAFAPGIGDPEEFALFDCETQRNLSEEGILQAKRIGDRFRANGVLSAEVFTSQWCRCQDTANHLNLGATYDLTVLNSFFRDFEHRDSRTNGLLKWLRNYSQVQKTSSSQSKSLVLVTHQVNISALLGVGTTSGEMVVFHLNSEGEPEVKGSIVTH